MKKFISLFLVTIILLTGCTNNSTEEIKVEPKKDLISNNLEADVVVVGAGGAGMTAAIEAHDSGAKVIIIEKMPFAGGNTVRAKGGLNAAETSTQKEMEIEDSVEVFYEDTFKGGKELNDKDVLKYFTENSANGVEWLKSIGMDLSDVAAGAGATNPRMHRPAGGIDVGPALVDTLTKNVKERNIKLLTNTKATKIITENNEVKSVLVEDINTNETYEINTDAIVVATGGFGANEELYTKYRTDLKGFITTNHSGATGDGIVMVGEVGGALVDMKQIQTNPTVEQETKEVISESIRGLGAIFVNNSGVRFTSEMLTRDVLSSKILEEEGEFAYIVFDQKLRENMKAVEGMIERGIVSQGETPTELAKALDINPDHLENTIKTWNSFVNNGLDEEFSRETGMDNSLETAPYYAIKVGPGVHHTMGGIKINSNAEVSKEDGSIIKGLYAAGETTGGVHGANRLGGNAVADITIFGRQAGLKSAEYALINGSLLEKNNTVKVEATKEKIDPSLSAIYKDGEFIGEAQGNNGTISAKVIVKDNLITDILIENHSETGPIFQSVEDILIPNIIYNQSTDIDTIAGATFSSNAILEILNNILIKK